MLPILDTTNLLSEQTQRGSQDNHSQVPRNEIIGMWEPEKLGGPCFQVLEIFLIAQDSFNAGVPSSSLEKNGPVLMALHT